MYAKGYRSSFLQKIELHLNYLPQITFLINWNKYLQNSKKKTLNLNSITHPVKHLHTRLLDTINSNTKKKSQPKK